MRRRIQTMVLTAVVVAVALFAIPLAVTVQSSIISDEQRALEKSAMRAAVTVSPGFQTDPIELPETEPGVAVAVYRLDGARIAGVGPSRLDDVLGEALHGTATTGSGSSELMAAVAVTSGENVIAVVRAASPRAVAQARVLSAWAGLAVLASFAIGCAGLWATLRSRRLIRPLTDLTLACTELGSGNFDTPAGRSDIPDVDRAAVALNITAGRLAQMMARERAFSANASHQLRTPLTALRLQLETGLAGRRDGWEPALRAAVATTDELERTIDDVLEIARADFGHLEPLDIDVLFDDVRSRWHGLLAAADRPLEMTVQHPRPPMPIGSAAAVRQILDVLVDNAYQHGHGTVTLRARDIDGTVAIDVLDEGSPAGVRLSPPAQGGGSRRLGLSLAQELARSQGGRLVLAGDGGPTRFTLLLPAPQPVEAADPR